jgi:selenocysteine lyase/cysteine desulfurase
MPRKILSEEFGFDIKYISIDSNYEIDWADFSKKYNNTVKVVSV